MHIKQPIYASLSAMVVATLSTFLCDGPLPAASNESKSLLGQEGRALAQPSQRSAAAEAPGQQTRGSKSPAQQGQEEQASPKEVPQHSTAPAQQKGAASPATAANPQAEQTAGAHPGVDIMFPEGKVEAILARDMTARSEPRSPSREFAEDAKQIYLVLTSGLAKAASVQVSWIAVSVEDTAQPQTGRLETGSRARPARNNNDRGVRGRFLSW
jgi:hypothetical protein